MDRSDSLVNWIQKLQSWGSVLFRYEHKGKRTIRVYNPNRDVAADIPHVAVNLERVENSGDLFYTSITAKTNMNHRTDVWDTYTARTYEAAAYREHRHYKPYEIECGVSDPTYKADLLHEDTYKTRPIFIVTVDADIYRPRIWDIITVDMSQEYQRGTREFYGVQRCVVIGIEPIPETDRYRLTLRQRDESTIWEG